MFNFVLMIRNWQNKCLDKIFLFFFSFSENLLKLTNAESSNVEIIFHVNIPWKSLWSLSSFISNSITFQALVSPAPIVPTKIIGDPVELDRYLIANGYAEAFVYHPSPSNFNVNPYIFSGHHSEIPLNVSNFVFFDELLNRYHK